MAEQITKLSEFYALMHSTVLPRKYLLDQALNEVDPYDKYITELKEALNQLKNFPKRKGFAVAELEGGGEVELDLTYEITELEKDLYFLSHPLPQFINFLAEQTENFTSEKNLIVDGMLGMKFRNFITDRDGTINNYCGRYSSSIQSIYNAYFLTNFAKKCVTNSVIVTSAPLSDIGLADISIVPKEHFILAGSMGREYLNSKGQIHRKPIPKNFQNKLNELNLALDNLTQQEENRKFRLIGSGLQHKFGQTTIARQDIHNSIPEQASAQFLKTVQELVLELDRAEEFFNVEDTGKDIEIILKLGNHEDGQQDFDKSRGLEFLNSHAKLKLNAGPSLICGDTFADALMIPVAKKFNKNSRTIFVTKDDNLKNKIERISPEAVFVSSPDILVTALHEIATGLI